MDKPKHGGIREGAGRKKEEDTKRIRVPVGCLNEVLEVISKHKTKTSGVKPQPRKTGHKSSPAFKPPMIQTKNGYAEARYNTPHILDHSLR